MKFIRSLACGLTHKPLPNHDPTIALLSEEERQLASSLWLGRAAGESKSIEGFLWIAESCEALGVSSDIVSTARQAAEDEERHSEICRRVASAYHGREMVLEGLKETSSELRPPDDPDLALALYFIESSCLSETIGAVTLEFCLKATTAPLAHTALRELLADEVEHARLGFSYLASPALDSQQRGVIAECLPVLFRDMMAYWDKLSTKHTLPILNQHGCLPFGELRSMVRTAFSEVALPGFAHVGIDTRPAAEYLAGLEKGL